MRISDWSSDVCSSDLRSLPPPRPAAPKAPLAASEHYGPAPLGFGANQDRLRETAPGISEQRILSHSSLRSPISLYQSSKCFWRPLCEIQASINVGTMIPSILDRKSTRLNSSH